MTAHRGRGSLGSALSDRVRAEAMHAVLQRGAEAAAAAGPEATSEWTALQQEFVAEATAKPQ
jgi:hypothetical protein|eukprot:9745-Heterococcus_DN1.PRE.3